MQNPPKALMAAIRKLLGSENQEKRSLFRRAADLLNSGNADDIDRPLPIPFLKKDATDDEQRKFVVAGMVGAFALAILLVMAAAWLDHRKAEFVARLQDIDTALQEAGTAIKLAPLGAEKDYELGDYAQMVLTSRLAAIRGSTLTPLGVELGDTVDKLDGVTNVLKSVMDRENSLTGFAKRTTRTSGLLSQVSQILDQVVLADQAAGGSANSPIYIHMRDSAQRAGNLVLQFVVVEDNAETNLRILTNDLNDIARLSGYFKGVAGVHVESPSRDIAVALGKIADISSDLIEYRKNVENAMESLALAKRAARDIDAMLDPLIEEVRKTTEQLRGRLWATLLYILAVAMAVVGGGCIVLMQAIHGRAARRQAVQARREQDETDEAIIRIMEELMPLSEGDLTARATVTEHVTGAIADRVNMAAESLQKAITDVKQGAAEAAQLMITVRAKSEGAIEDFEDAAFQASDSRNVAELGASVVADAVGKMDEARERMQDVSKRVKRLGEVSQSITSIVDLIEEVTQKTSILALNTSLKAAEAGEEGQAFQVIAKEIRDLSEDARKALRQIGQNVQMIQGETQSVIQTVETVTQDVVEGSRLWEDARITLNNITSSSEQIESMVKRLSDIAKEQADKAASATGVMSQLATSMGHFRTVQA